MVQQIKKLNNLILTTLQNLITSSRVILLDIPLYNNIGDVLIWQGTIDALKMLKKECIQQASMGSFNYPQLDNDIVILLSGGGNFGDIWYKHQEFRSKVIEHYPNNRIIILPQTVFYNNPTLLRKDAKIFAKHTDLHICIRDTKSFDYLSGNFSNHLYLLPDMAFCIDSHTIQQYQKRHSHKKLILIRKDCEFKESKSIPSCDSSKFDYSDWPTIEKENFTLSLINKCLSYEFFFLKLHHNWTLSLFRKYMIKTGIAFLSQYEEVYSTRLHVSILSILLGIPITIYDNSYGKNSNFYNTWLIDFQNVKLL